MSEASSSAPDSPAAPASLPEAPRPHIGLARWSLFIALVLLFATAVLAHLAGRFEDDLAEANALLFVAMAALVPLTMGIVAVSRSRPAPPSGVVGIVCSGFVVLGATWMGFGFGFFALPHEDGVIDASGTCEGEHLRMSILQVSAGRRDLLLRVQSREADGNVTSSPSGDVVVHANKPVAFRPSAGDWRLNPGQSRDLLFVADSAPLGSWDRLSFEYWREDAGKIRVLDCDLADGFPTAVVPGP